MLLENAEQVVPSLHSMQQEPAWPAIVAGHQPEDWPESAPPDCHQDLVYLSSEKALSDQCVQVIRSFYLFIWVCLHCLMPQHASYLSYIAHGITFAIKQDTWATWSLCLNALSSLQEWGCMLVVQNRGFTLLVRLCVVHLRAWHW